MPGHRCSESLQEFRIVYFAGQNIEAGSLGLERCSCILNIQDLHCESVKATGEVSHDDRSPGIKN